MKHVRTRDKLLALAVGLVAAACGAEVPDGAEVETKAEPITGGQLAFSPYSSVVMYADHCTATKISARRFVTAVHCLGALIDAAHLTPTLPMSKAKDASTNVVEVKLVQAFMHPSQMTANLYGQFEVSAYDVAVLEVDRDTPDFGESPINSIPFGDGFTGNLVGYGCDKKQLDPRSRLHFKQTAIIKALSFAELRNSLPTHSTSFLQSHYSHYVTFGNGLATCGGDSGGPTFRNSFNGVAAITSNGDDKLSHLARTANIRMWIENPVHNVFRAGSGGFLLSAGAGTCATDLGNGAAAGRYCSAPSQDTDVQYWTLRTHSSPDYYSLVNGSTGKCLTELSNGNVSMATCDGSFSQGWRFTEAIRHPKFSFQAQTTDVVYYMIQGKSGRCVQTFPQRRANHELRGV